ncbi:MAG: CYTH domain-containing protein [Nitrospirae bacterium]|nr:CYTH domain-containing protein [Nitrospirota bacterium]MCL5976529.1 CYTH domain-containing protein [Nitrospirota bacterium]
MIIKEKERKLLVNVSDGSQVYEQIMKLEKLGDFHVEGSKHFKTQDIYLDNKEFILAKKSGYLRIRGKTSGHLITIRKNKDGVIDEVSHPLDDEGIRIVLAALADNFNIHENPQMILPYFSEVFKSIGLTEVLRVAIDRTERDIFLEDVGIGKMKIDIFKYLFPKEFGPFYEVEVISYKKAFHGHIDNFISSLKNNYKEVIEGFELSKYFRGINIAYGFNFK